MPEICLDCVICFQRRKIKNSAQCLGCWIGIFQIVATSLLIDWSISRVIWRVQSGIVRTVIWNQNNSKTASMLQEKLMGWFHLHCSQLNWVYRSCCFSPILPASEPHTTDSTRVYAFSRCSVEKMTCPTSIKCADNTRRILCSFHIAKMSGELSS